MRKIIIPQKEIKNRHPKGLTSYTDGDYAKFASKLLAMIEAFGVADMTSQEKKDIAINLTMYFEDVLADAGIWRGFTNQMQDMYGKFLPFYSIDEQDYYQDEPNLEDVKFVIWNTLVNSRVPQGRVTNPETPVITDLSPVLYHFMQEQFEQMPVNDDLKTYFEKAEFMDDFYQQRDLLKWIAYDCYLTAIPDSDEAVMELAQEYSKVMQGNLASAMYLAESVIPFSRKVGPLAVYPIYWLAMILLANGDEEKMHWAEEEEFLTSDIYRIVKADRNKGMTLESNKGEKFFVSDDGLANPEASCYDCKCVVGSFVKYRGEWFVNADSVWMPGGVELFEMTKKEVAEKNVTVGPLYDKLMKKSGGSPFFYFANYSELTDFLVKEMGMPKKFAKEAKFPDVDNTGFVLGVLGRDKPFGVFAGGAEVCLKEDRNPYYDAKKAKSKAFHVAMKLPAPLLKYAMEHDMLPDAQLNSVFGEERGKELVRNDYDFLARALMKDEYEEGE